MLPYFLKKMGTIDDVRSSKRRLQSAGLTGNDKAAGEKERHQRKEDEQEVDDNQKQSDDGDISEENASLTSEG